MKEWNHTNKVSGVHHLSTSAKKTLGKHYYWTLIRLHEVHIVCSHFREEGEAQEGGITSQSHTAIALSFLTSSLTHLTNHDITC